MTYARARLWTGIAGVGTWVLVAGALLATGWHARLLVDLGGSPLADARALAAVFLIGVGIALPFDVAGGLVLPRRHGRATLPATTLIARWARGVGVLGALVTGCGVAILAAGRALGTPGGVLAFAALAALALSAQGRLARWIGGLRPTSPDRLPIPVDGARLLVGGDPGFTGGFSGWRAQPIWPEAWASVLDVDQWALLAERRRQIVASGAWRRTQLAALGWNTLGFGLAAALPGAGVASVAQLVTTALGFTLWTFLGLLLLPAVSRRATARADAAVAGDPRRRERLVDALRRIDRLQDDEPVRSAALESVFHPVSSVANRERALAATSPGRPPFAWHLARTALFLSHVGLCPLGRSVHCNAGRPELWVYLPADG